MPGRAVLVGPPGADVVPALLAQGWSVSCCRADEAAAAVGDDIDLIVCPMALDDGRDATDLLAALLEDHPDAGGLIYGEAMPDGYAETLGRVPGVPVMKTSACPTLLRLTIECALARPRA